MNSYLSEEAKKEIISFFDRCIGAHHDATREDWDTESSEQAQKEFADLERKFK